MKKELLLGLSITFVLTAGAQIITPECSWSNLFDGGTSAGDQATNAVVSADGNVYWQLSGGTTSSSLSIYYGGKLLFDGSDYDENGTSYNNNLAILKTDKNGKLIWELHSESCDFVNNEGGVASMPDGGAVFTARIRCSDLGGGICQWEPITIIDGKGNKTEISWNQLPTDSRRFYKGILGRLDKEGNLMWIKNIETSRDAVPGGTGSYADFQSEALKINTITTDTSGNVYIGGNFRTILTVEGSDLMLVPSNVENWTGDPQANVGDMFIMSFDSEGNVIDSLTATGKADMTAVQKLVFDNDNIYALLDVRGEAELNLAGREIKTSGVFNPVIVKLNDNSEAEWITVLKGENVQNKYGYQNANISVYGETIWLTAQVNGKISYSDSEFVETYNGSTREGLLIGLNVSDGSWKAGALSRTGGYNAGLTGYISSFQAPKDNSNVYVFGYVMNASQGVFIRRYNTENLSTDSSTEWKIITGGGVPTAQSFAYDANEGEIYVSARGNKAFNLLGGEANPVPSSWGVLLAGFKMPEDFRTGIERVEEIEHSAIKIYMENDNLVFISDEMGKEISIYDISGRVVKDLILSKGKNVVTLPPGFYIVENHKFIVR